MSNVYEVSGMTCEGCANALTKAIKAVAPGAIVDVDVEGNRVAVEGFEDATIIAAAVENAGFEFGGSANSME